jgi:hypothetical protein
MLMLSRADAAYALPAVAMKKVAVANKIDFLIMCSS